MERILITGAAGQIGAELTKFLIDIHGQNNVLATDIIEPNRYPLEDARYRKLDVLDSNALGNIVQKERPTQIFHLAALLSAKSEKQPLTAWRLNMDGLLAILEVARELKVPKVYWPSSIAVFGPDTPSQNTPQNTVMNPITAYGISKLAGERWCEYYYRKYQLDIRSLRYPGLIGYKSMPGGGTTDYAVEIFRKAIESEPYECFLKADTYLPMMYMGDAINATLQLMQAPSTRIKVRSSYNLRGISCSPKDLFEGIKKFYPAFQISYKPDYRQEIADHWPDSIDDREARKDWGWQPQFDLELMIKEILINLPKYLLHPK
ncbi:NAD-dependent epimerase/dehydratase family protein [Echinicola jeungdonensis]|uniref:NAD-dependent epimerase/dehydratase family protein n=1 Tax=Echinicola jeungdonensis TaxID=709343 RepID=A0ABV5J0Y1_9BACT|nr:NAD-dependent epimerase/dehydratase family protein [Echinicola jeungdonensis]MDN3668306.1 NAD-dependent epimerase/dehydratase family protein [Echinicola jeungdonensis]